MNTLLISLIVTWTDIFYGIGTFFEWCFKGMRAMGQGPNVIISALVIGGILFWTLKLAKYKKVAQRDGTYE